MNRSNEIIYDFEEDALRITKSFTQFNQLVGVDTWTYKKLWLWMRAHIDFIQIIATNELPNGQFSLADIEGIVIKYCTIISQAQIQPIFSSDGIIKSIEIENNMFMTKSQHHIALCGVLNIKSFNNIFINDGKKELAKTVLYPARIAGGLNIHVLEYKNTYVMGRAQGDNVEDKRIIPQRGTNLINFDVESFKAIVAEDIPRETPTKKRVKMIKEIALECGDKA